MSYLQLENPEFVFADKIDTLSFANGKLPDYITSTEMKLSASEEYTFECEVNMPLFSKLTGVDMSHSPDISSFTLIAQKPYQVQVRRHRKKRINKKWAKRYGYITKFKNVRLEDVRFTRDNEDLIFTGNVYI